MIGLPTGLFSVPAGDLSRFPLGVIVERFTQAPSVDQARAWNAYTGRPDRHMILQSMVIRVNVTAAAVAVRLVTLAVRLQAVPAGSEIGELWERRAAPGGALTPDSSSTTFTLVAAAVGTGSFNIPLQGILVPAGYNIRCAGELTDVPAALDFRSTVVGLQVPVGNLLP